jgi:hypothetical protein
MGRGKGFRCSTCGHQAVRTEAAVDAAWSKPEMMAELVQARKDLGLSATVANGATAKLIAAVAALSEARTAVVEAHAELDETRLRLGIRTKLIGGKSKGRLAPVDQ